MSDANLWDDKLGTLSDQHVVKLKYSADFFYQIELAGRWIIKKLMLSYSNVLKTWQNNQLASINGWRGFLEILDQKHRLTVVIFQQWLPKQGYTNKNKYCNRFYTLLDQTSILGYSANNIDLHMERHTQLLCGKCGKLTLQQFMRLLLWHQSGKNQAISFLFVSSNYAFIMLTLPIPKFSWSSLQLSQTNTAVFNVHWRGPPHLFPVG